MILSSHGYLPQLSHFILVWIGGHICAYELELRLYNSKSDQWCQCNSISRTAPFSQNFEIIRAYLLPNSFSTDNSKKMGRTSKSHNNHVVFLQKRSKGSIPFWPILTCLTWRCKARACHLWTLTSGPPNTPTHSRVGAWYFFWNAA